MRTPQNHGVPLQTCPANAYSSTILFVWRALQFKINEERRKCSQWGLSVVHKPRIHVDRPFFCTQTVGDSSLHSFDLLCALFLNYHPQPTILLVAQSAF